MKLCDSSLILNKPTNFLFNATGMYHYNLNSDIKSLAILNKDDNRLENGLVAYEHIYDSIGNWIEQIKSVTGKPLYIWRREIKYFP